MREKYTLALGLLVLSTCHVMAQATTRKPGDSLSYEIVVHSQLSGGHLPSQAYAPQDALPEIELVRNDLWRAVLHAVAYYALGRQKEADAALSELIARYHARSAWYSAYTIALVYAFRKQSDEAFQWLDRAYAEHDDGLIYTKVDPLPTNLHNDLRYAALLKKLNLPN